MEDKEKLLKQIENIHNCIINNEKIVSYSRNKLFLWGFTSAIMFLSFEFILNFSLIYATLYLIFLSIFSMLVGIYLTKIDNIKYELLSYTDNQKFIDINYLVIIILAIILTYIVSSNHIGYYSYPIWIFLIGFGHLNSGFILSNRYFKIIGVINIITGLFLFLDLSFFQYKFIYSNLKYISTLVGSGSVFFLAFNMKK